MKLIKSERSIENMSNTKNTNKTDRLDIRCRPENELPRSKLRGI